MDREGASASQSDSTATLRGQLRPTDIKVGQGSEHTTSVGVMRITTKMPTPCATDISKALNTYDPPIVQGTREHSTS